MIDPFPFLEFTVRIEIDLYHALDARTSSASVGGLSDAASDSRAILITLPVTN